MRVIKITFIFLLVVLFYANQSFALSVNVFPQSFSVPANTSSTRNLTYELINTSDCGTGHVYSSGGKFITTTGVALGTISNQINLNGAGSTANESLLIPYSVIQNARNYGVSSFLYKRNFTCTTFSTFPPTITTSVIINIQQPPISSFSVSISPQNFSVAYNRNFTKIVTYSFSNIDACRNHPTSSFGTFVTNSNVVLGKVNKTVKERNKTAIERLNIPSSIMRNAQHYNASIFNYKRTFTCYNYSGSPIQVTAQTKINLLSKAAMPLTITRVRLYFKNNKAEISIKQNQLLTAYVDINFMGSGMFKGYWEVDGRVLSPMVFKNLTYGKKITLQTPSTPPLPTFSFGTHFVKFVVTQPKPVFEMPQAIYFVEFGNKKLNTLDIVSPKNNETIKLKQDMPIQFVWKPEKRDSFYLIEFFSPESKKPLFSAYTETSSYVMPPYIIKHYFKKYEKYNWRVESFSKNSFVMGKSNLSSFTIK